MPATAEWALRMKTVGHWNDRPTQDYHVKNGWMTLCRNIMAPCAMKCFSREYMASLGDAIASSWTREQAITMSSTYYAATMYIFPRRKKSYPRGCLKDIMDAFAAQT